VQPRMGNALGDVCGVDATNPACSDQTKLDCRGGHHLIIS
jgi:hypothetical protein